MSDSFHLTDPVHFTAGTVGPPGQRVFYLQAAEGADVVAFRMEKQQVAALAEYLSGVLADLPAVTTPVADAPELAEPVVEAWTVGGIGIAVDEDADRIILVIHELVVEEPEASEDEEVAELLAELAGLVGDDPPEDDEDPFDDEDDDLFDEDSEGGIARLRITREQAAAFVTRAGELMSRGRPLCPFCGLPEGPGGHICPRAN